MVRAIGVGMALLYLSGCAGALDLADPAKRPSKSATDRKRALDQVEEDAGDGGEEALEEAGGSSGKRGRPVAVSDDDPSDIRDAAEELGRMEEALAAGDFAAYGTAQKRAFGKLESDSEDVRRSKKRRPLAERVRELDVRFAAQAGGHAAEIMKDGARSREASEDGLTAVAEALHACNRAAKATLSTDSKGRPVELDTAYAEYEKKLARARKVDARALRHAGKDASGPFNHDHAIDFALCEAEVANKRLELADSSPMERFERSSARQCGYYEWVFAAPRIRGSKFGSFELDGVHTDNVFPYPCKKFPRKSKVPGVLTDAIRSGIKVSRGEVLVMQGGFRVSQTDDFVVKKYATVRHYSKNAEIVAGECGESDPRIGCENNGSRTARAYNHVAHFSKRASVHRKAGRTLRCKELLKQATSYAEDWSRNEANDPDGEKKFSRHKTIDGILTDAEVKAAIPKLGDQADDRALGSWCSGGGGGGKASK